MIDPVFCGDRIQAATINDLISFANNLEEVIARIEDLRGEILREVEQYIILYPRPDLTEILARLDALEKQVAAMPAKFYAEIYSRLAAFHLVGNVSVIVDTTETGNVYLNGGTDLTLSSASTKFDFAYGNHDIYTPPAPPSIYSELEI